MAHSNQAKKRVRQNETAQLRNKGKKSEIRTWVKKTHTAVEAGDKDEAQKCFRIAIKKLDKAGKTNVLHPNTISRKKSSLSKLLHTAGIQQ